MMVVDVDNVFGRRWSRLRLLFTMTTTIRMETWCLQGQVQN
jgi:hypothetical protein